jgi:hypothetical protein
MQQPKERFLTGEHSVRVTMFWMVTFFIQLCGQSGYKAALQASNLPSLCSKYRNLNNKKELGNPCPRYYSDGASLICPATMLDPKSPATTRKAMRSYTHFVRERRRRRVAKKIRGDVTDVCLNELATGQYIQRGFFLLHRSAVQ